MLRATDVWFGYGGTPVLRGVSLTIPSDGFVGILGPNGAGKTTMLRLLAGVRRPYRGRIELDGVPLEHHSRAALAQRMAVVPQETQLAFDYTVTEIALMGRYAHLGPFEIEGPGDLAIADRALAGTGTAHLRSRPFASLSGGEKQRVIIASALAQIFRGPLDCHRKPEPTSERAEGLLLLDEPTASLDLAYQLDVAALLQTLHARERIAVILSTHDLNLAARLCRTVILLRDGAVVASGPTRDVLTAANIRDLYGVDADVIEHPSGRRIIVPLSRASAGSSP
jgi:iron complex transport system ATP-binding protein